MTTKTPPEIEFAPSESKLKQIYLITDELSEIIPIQNERYRLGFCLNLFIEKQIETLLDAIDQAKPVSSKLDFPELEKLISEKLKNFNLI